MKKKTKCNFIYSQYRFKINYFKFASKRTDRGDKERGRNKNGGRKSEIFDPNCLHKFENNTLFV
jgi:hypothetical protein